jgi:endoglucanase
VNRATTRAILGLAAASCSSLVALAGLGAQAGAATDQARPALARASSSGCSDPYPAKRDRENPLMLTPAPPPGNPLGGAHFFVDGPAHGRAAQAIAHLLGIDRGTPVGKQFPSFPVTEPWTTFASYISSHIGSVSAHDQHQIAELEKIASQPEAQRISLFSAGGTPAGIYQQTTKLFCGNFTADPNTIPVITTYFLHAKLGGCGTRAQMAAYRPTFERQINAMVRATGRRPVVYLLELDAVGSSACMAHQGDLGAWESLLRYEVDKVGSLPHAVVYLEGGYSDANNPRYAARILNRSDIRKIQGFFTNDTHLNWTINEIHYGQAIAKRTHGAHFVIDTADNGNGPKLNPHPTTQGIEDLCSPPGRALGPPTNTATGYKYVDAYLWTHVPGNGGCGTNLPSGSFDISFALGLAERANARLGPRFPSKPY